MKTIKDFIKHFKDIWSKQVNTTVQEVCMALSPGNFLSVCKMSFISQFQIYSFATCALSFLCLSRSYQKTSMRTVLSALRMFLSFLWMTGETATNLTLAIPSSGARKVEVVPTLTAAEEVQLLQSMERSTALGKRNYAMVLLGIRTGLRTADIINLKLTDIDWRSNTINIIQQKNRRPLSLPLLPDFGNALVDYLERPA